MISDVLHDALTDMQRYLDLQPFIDNLRDQRGVFAGAVELADTLQLIQQRFRLLEEQARGQEVRLRVLEPCRDASHGVHYWMELAGGGRRCGYCKIER